jgi:hypothetical protein
MQSGKRIAGITSGLQTLGDAKGWPFDRAQGWLREGEESELLSRNDSQVSN